MEPGCIDWHGSGRLKLPERNPVIDGLRSPKEFTAIVPRDLPCAPRDNTPVVLGQSTGTTCWFVVMPVLRQQTVRIPQPFKPSLARWRTDKRERKKTEHG